MTIYISRGRFTSDAVKGMLAKPENREEAVAKLFKSVGGRLIGWYLTFGHHDWLAIGEFPDEKAAASAVLAAAGGGSLSDVETTVAMTAKDALATFQSAAKAAKAFRSAGRSSALIGANRFWTAADGACVDSKTVIGPHDERTRVPEAGLNGLAQRATKCLLSEQKRTSARPC